MNEIPIPYISRVLSSIAKLLHTHHFCGTLTTPYTLTTAPGTGRETEAQGVRTDGHVAGEGHWRCTMIYAQAP